MMGPRGCGVNTQAQKLKEEYGWRVVDFIQIVKDKLNEILSQPQKLPNNLCTDIGPCMVCLSEQELQDIKEGKPMPSWKFIPWILEFLGVPLKVKEKPPPEPDSETDAEWDDVKLKQHKDKMKKKKKEAELAAKAAAEAAQSKAERAAKRLEALENGQDLIELGLQESEEEIIIEDFPIDYIIPDTEKEGHIPDKFIMIGFPQTETHCLKLKEYGIEFDRILFLSDKSEENVGQEITDRMNLNSQTAYDYEAELEIANNIIAIVKENCIPEEREILKEIDCSGTIEEVFIKIKTEVDPFFCQADNPDDVFISEDFIGGDEDEGKKRIPKSDFGNFCPVTYVDSNSLIKGSEEQELFVYGKRYLFAGETELEKFKFNPAKYMPVQSNGASLPLAPPAPKIMITGTKCSGVTSQIKMLCEKYKLESCEFMKEYQKLEDSELKARQRTRLLDRGFKGIPEQDDPDAEPEVDEEIINDPDDFEKNP